MAIGSRQYIAGLRKFHQEEIETIIRQMKIGGGTLDDCVDELNLLSEFVESQANTLKDRWPNLLQGTSHQSGGQGLVEVFAALDAAKLPDDFMSDADRPRIS